MSDESEEQWEVYPGRVSDDFAMFAVNLAPQPDAPFDNLRWLNIIRLGFESSTNGMPDGETNAFLYEVEDMLSAKAGARGAIHVGRLTLAGRRELFFYAATNDADLMLSVVQEEFGDELDVDALGQLDPEWKVYLDFLYPSPLDFQRIHNQRVVRLLGENGDNPAIPRQVDHTAVFPTNESLRTFMREIADNGFAIDETVEGDDGELRFRLMFSNESPTDLGTIDRLTIGLFVRIEELGGMYDGWGCPIATDDE